MTMWLAKLISVVVLVWCLRWLIREWRGPKVAYWTLLEHLHCPTALVQDAVTECFGEGERFAKGLSTIDFYTRGDTRIRRVSDARRVRLSDVPSTLCIGVDNEPGKTLVTLRLEIERRQVKIPWGVAKQFDSAAETELSEAMRKLEQTAARLLREREAQRQRQSQRSQDPPAPSAAGSADYATLGLKPEATTEQVHAAYRDACRKYHPDRLNGQNVEPHPVELAVQRFKEVTAAYQRLKDRVARA
jgi:DnaJ-domain-containing protein 1